MRQIIVCFISVLVGVLLGFFLHPILELAKEADQTTVIVEHEWLENQLFPHIIKEEYHGKPTSLLDSLLEAIDFTIKDDTHRIFGYHFYQGYAKIRRNDGKIEGLDVYSVYDTTLYDALIPTYQIDFYKHGGFSIIYNGMQDELYIAVNDGNFQTLKKGVLEKKWFSDFVEKDLEANIK